MLVGQLLQRQLPRTWPFFFAHHGNFTSIQLQAIPVILNGDNTLMIAATAGGKTEAAIAPLLERHAWGVGNRGAREHKLCILYICPTRALVRDLYERLRRPLEDLAIPFAMKSGDTGPVSTSHPPAVLITTPESTDSLLTRAPRLFAPLRAIVLDEIHLFDDGPRGDHLRCLLRRIEYIRDYHQRELNIDAEIPLQRVALSATVPDPVSVAHRYLCDREETRTPVIIEAPGRRYLRAETHPMFGLGDLVTALDLRAGGQAAMRKSLIFCNTRNEVEQVAAYLREYLPFAAAIFVHYSNLDPAMRREVEEDFATAGVAICVCTSTLELGIDIGSIDDVVLIGPPPTLTSFLQRIGRGGRRSDTTHVLCLARSPLEEIRFRALIDLATAGNPSPTNASQTSIASTHPLSITTHGPTFDSRSSIVNTPPFRLSVLIQQIFSMLRQSPTGGVRVADLQRMAPEPVENAILRRILNHLASLGYVQAGRLGEWRAGPSLDELLDAHEIYSNIGAEPLAALVVDAYTGRTIAQTERIHLQGGTLLMGGRVLEVVWRDRYRLGVRPLAQGIADEELRFHTEPFAIPLDVAQAVAAHLKLQPGQMCLLHEERGAWLFHFWGDIYGEWLAAMLQTHFGDRANTELITQQNEYSLYLPASLPQLPPWNSALAQHHLRRLAPRLKPFLALGRFHSLLPPELATDTVIALCDLPHFERLYTSSQIVTPPAALRSRLQNLLP